LSRWVDSFTDQSPSADERSIASVPNRRLPCLFGQQPPIGALNRLDPPKVVHASVQPILLIQLVCTKQLLWLHYMHACKQGVGAFCVFAACSPEKPFNKAVQPPAVYFVHHRKPSVTCSRRVLCYYSELVFGPTSCVSVWPPHHQRAAPLRNMKYKRNITLYHTVYHCTTWYHICVWHTQIFGLENSKFIGQLCHYDKHVILLQYKGINISVRSLLITYGCPGTLCTLHVRQQVFFHVLQPHKACYSI
jgi:hypothetical protein